MKIVKVINNNVVSSKDMDGNEIILMGKGIGFKAKEGDEVYQEQIEKIFRMDNSNALSRFQEVLSAMPMENIQVSSEIIEYATQTVGKKLNQNIYITLTDHINFAIERFNRGMNYDNPLLWDVKRFYPSEYLIGEYAVALINKKLHTSMTEDEAAVIALHVLNAEYDTSMKETLNIPTMIHDILEIVKEFRGKPFVEEGHDFQRFVTHLKFLAQRTCTNQQLRETDANLTNMVAQSYKEEHQCTRRIEKYILQKYRHTLSKEEITYLTLHIKRLGTTSDL